MVIEIVAGMSVAADVFQVHDLDEIGRFGVMQTPALVINDKIVSRGTVPSVKNIKELLGKA